MSKFSTYMDGVKKCARLMDSLMGFSVELRRSLRVWSERGQETNGTGGNPAESSELRRVNELEAWNFNATTPYSFSNQAPAVQLQYTSILYVFPSPPHSICSSNDPLSLYVSPSRFRSNTNTHSRFCGYLEIRNRAIRSRGAYSRFKIPRFISLDYIPLCKYVPENPLFAQFIFQ